VSQSLLASPCLRGHQVGSDSPQSAREMSPTTRPRPYTPTTLQSLPHRCIWCRRHSCSAG